MDFAAIVAAAGEGLRMDSAERKQYLCLGNKPVLAHSLSLFLDHPGAGAVIAVIPPGEGDAVRALLNNHCDQDKVIFVEGGATRRESVARGLAVLSPGTGLVCIHDAARPLASAGLLDRLLETASCFGSAVPVIPLSDTVKEVDDGGFIMSTPVRSRLRLAQTPQVFQYELIMAAYGKMPELSVSGLEVTDDASLVELSALMVKTIPGELTNLKITTPLDLVIAHHILEGAE